MAVSNIIFDNFNDFIVLHMCLLRVHFPILNHTYIRTWAILNKFQLCNIIWFHLSDNFTGRCLFPEFHCLSGSYALLCGEVKLDLPVCALNSFPLISYYNFFLSFSILMISIEILLLMEIRTVRKILITTYIVCCCNFGYQ